ncbi:hypothetical protein DVT68_17650 [Dyella solisilvae]|uniref:Uncharacterized protein n=1 Tax=Dyella solisilvae TaxID=1920168 RepID=A0A370K432_9GAMM|nr:hypothetical protein [Dyella solisilvae]RDI97187.1 hypothetical protein DVT68_17650 [Dyella solisilvae]
MRAGLRLAMAVAMLGVGPLASGVDDAGSAPDAVATRVQQLLSGRYRDADGRDQVGHVLDVEKRLGAYRAARNRAEFILRLNADLKVATHDPRVRVCDGIEPLPAGVDPSDVGMGLQLIAPTGGLQQGAAARRPCPA